MTFLAEFIEQTFYQIASATYSGKRFLLGRKARVHYLSI
jgi:hypothetical protein